LSVYIKKGPMGGPFTRKIRLKLKEIFYSQGQSRYCSCVSESLNVTGRCFGQW